MCYINVLGFCLRLSCIFFHGTIKTLALPHCNCSLSLLAEIAHFGSAIAMQTLWQIFPRSLHLQTPHEDARWRKMLQVRPLSLRLSHGKASQNASPHAHRFEGLKTFTQHLPTFICAPKRFSVTVAISSFRRKTVRVRRVRPVLPTEATSEKAQELVSHAGLLASTAQRKDSRVWRM